VSIRDFFQPDTKKKVADAVKEVELQTAAEIVVAVHARSGSYRHTDHVVGALLAFATLLVLLFHPLEFAVEWMPANVLLAFVVGELISVGIPGLRRALTSQKVMNDNVRLFARSAFIEMGISQTRGRTGVLVYVSFFERRVDVIADSGVHVAEMIKAGSGWGKALTALDDSLSGTPDLEAFLAGVRLLAAPLAEALPVQPDDINELPDEPAFE
jgi:putative membrane protein